MQYLVYRKSGLMENCRSYKKITGYQTLIVSPANHYHGHS